MTNKRCPKCSELGHDKTGDHLFLMARGDRYCCNKPYHPIYYESLDGEVYNGSTEDINTMDIDGIKKLPYWGNEDRLISKEVHEHFKVRTELNEETGQPKAIFYPETIGGKFIGYKKRSLPKAFSTIHKEGTKGVVDFFGAHCCPPNGKKLLITGGEEDCLAAYEMLIERYPEYPPSVVSLPRGETGSMATITEALKMFEGYEEVVLNLDMDEAGKKAVALYAPFIGEKVRVMHLSEKDASDMRVKGKQQEFINAYFKAREWRPSNIVKVSEILEEAVQPVKWGLSYPWKALTQMTYGLKEGGEIISIGAGPGRKLPL